MKPEFSGQIFEKYMNTKFNENPSAGESSCPMRTYGRIEGQTALTHVIVASRSFANVLKNACV
jgi:hypothetical protein